MVIWLVAALLWIAAVGSRLGIAAQKPAPEAVEPSQDQIAAARGSLDRFLDSHPEIEADVVGDPTRIGNPDYVRDHPELQAFLENHPLVKADPRSFVSPGTWRFQSRRSEMNDFLSDAIPFLVFLIMLIAVLWVLRVILENRRWNRSFKVHEEVHTKLLEKFSSVQELAAYMESDAGKRLLEWTPATFETQSRMPFAASRILWSLQAGLTLALVGIGLLLLRGRIPDGAEPLLVCGTLGLTVGAGFVLSAIISYGLSKHLGLIAAGGGAQGGASLSSMQAGR